MGNDIFNRRKFSLLTSTALTRQAATFSALGLAFSAGSAFALDPNALPVDPNVVGGAATFNQSGATLTVNQSTNRTVIDWRSFDIGSNATTNFVQPNSSSIAVNRVNGSANPTEIQGTLNANGQVWILNPNGVLFGKNAQIDVAGIVASTGNISVQSFMSGDTRLQLSGADGGSVTNEGAITIADGGLAAFVAPAVRNSGVIHARVGKVTLAAGTTFTLDLAGDQLVEIGLGANNALVDQSGQLIAEGSTVNLTAKSASAVVDSVVNVSGTVLASGVHEDGGAIVLTADNVTTTGDAVLRADGGTNGNGGTITAYANKSGSYDGTFSAKGGAEGGNGGAIETSGKKVEIASTISVNTLAPRGETGNWTIDPDDLTVTDGANAGAVDPDASTITNGTVVNQLLTTSVTLAANNSITVDGAINSSGAGNLALNDQNADGDLTINLNATIKLGSGKTLSGQGSVVNVANSGSIQNGVDVAKAGGATVNVAAGTYEAGISINKNGLTLSGAEGTKINIVSGTTTSNGGVGVKINANNVTLKGFEFAGDVVGDQSTLDWNAAGYSWGVQVLGATNTNISIVDNNFYNLRSGVLIANSGNPITGAASGVIANNLFENTKGGILIQYRDGSTFDIHGNSQGQYGNEWGIVTGLQLAKINSDASLSRQAQILAWSEENNGLTVLDRQYATANRSSVTVDATGVATAADDFGLGNGVGNERQPLNNIQAGVNAVVAGGTVNVKDGTYVISSGYLSIGKSLNLIGESEAGTIIDAHGASSYGLRVIGGTSDVNLSDFTLYGVVAAGGYGIKVEDSQNVNITNVTSKGAYKAQIDLNGLRGGTLDNVTADGTPSAWGSGSTKGAAIAITDSQNILVKNSSTNGGSYGGIAIYQSNKAGSGYSYQTDNITIAASNTYGEANPVYMQDDSATNNFGTVTVEGFDYIARNTNPADTYTWFQKTQQGAIDIAAAAAGYVEGWLGSAGNNIFTVGYNTAGTVALSINNAINAASNGATVNLLSGVYDEAVTVNKGLTLQGADADDRASLTKGITLSGSISDVSLKNLDVKNVGAASGSFIIRASGSINGFSMDNVSVDGQNDAGLHGVGGSSILGDISITNSEFKNIGNWAVFDNSSGGSGRNVTSFVFANNIVDNVKGGITVRQGDGGTGSITIENNTVRNIGDSAQSSGGIFKIFNAGTVNFADNAISDIGTNASVSSDGVNYGAALLVRGVNTLNVTDNSFTNVHMAVAVEKGKAAPGQTTFTGNTFDNNGYVFFMPGDALNGGNVTFGAGNEINSGADTIQYIVWRNSNALDLTGVQFNGKLGSQMTDAELFATEDLITHGTDLASSGLATVKAGNVYVTETSGTIQFAVNKVAAGDTINVAAGTYGAFGTSFGGASDVTIQSADGAVIDGTGLTGRIIDLRADGTKLTGFTVNGDGGGVGVSISGRDVTVSGNTINGTLTGVQTTTQYAAGNATISGNTIDTAYGISLQNTGNTVSNNNVTASVEGVGLLKSANTFTDNTFDIGASGNAMVLYGASASDLNAARNSVNIAGGALQGAVDLAGTDGDLNLAAGNYTLASTLNINKSGLTLDGAGEGLTNITSNATGYGLLVNADDVTLSSFTLNGPASGLYGIKVGPSTGAASDRLLNFAIDHVTINGSKKTGLDLNGVNGATIDHVTVRNTTNGNGIALTDSADVTITNSTTSNNAWGGLALYQTNKAYDQQVTDIRVDGTNTFDEANGIYAQDQSATNDFGVIDLAGQGIAYVAKIATGGTDGDYTFFQKLKQGAYDIGDAFNTRYGLTGATVQGYAEANKDVEGNNAFYVGHATGGGALSVNAAVQSSVAGDTVNVDAGTYNEDVVVDGASRNLAFDGSTLDSLTTNVATAIGGTVTAAGGFLLNAATTLLSDTVLNGAVTAGAIDGTTAGGQSLAINGGSGAVTLGNLGATTRLGAVSVTGTGMTAFNGSSYVANSLHFGGPATLTKALTTFDTSAAGGDITFSGPLFGTADSAQSVAFLAGTGTGGANGDISIQNAGTDSIWLGSMTVRGDDFSGATVYVGGDYNALLTGDQTFTTDTLHTKGSVTSTVGGDATGPIVSGGNVGVNAGGNFSGNVTAPTAEIHGNTITGTFNGGTLTLFADNGVDVIANVTTLNVTSPGGTVDGTFSTINTGGSGSLIVNGKTRTGNNATDPNQIVVEGFTLPAGTIITPSGEIILPSGMMIGLISPAAGGSAQGGKPKVILVHSVQKLGELLAQGYVAIIVDLSGNKDEEQEIAMAQ